MGTKGGCGKTTVAMGLAAWMSQLSDKKYLLIDGDMHVRSVELKMCPAYDVTLADVLTGAKPWDEAVYACQLESEGELLYPNLAILPAGGRFLPPLEGNPLEYFELTRRTFNQMIQGLRKKFETIVVDTPASMSFEHLILTAVADALIYVCEPSDDSVNSTTATAVGLKQFMDVSTLGTVLNRIRRKGDEQRWVKKLERIGRVLGVIPEDELVTEAFTENFPVVAAYPESKASLAMKKIAERLLKIKVKPMPLDEKLERAMEKTVEKIT
jgi:flagellar biosynthesis protein FlhG